MDDLDWLRHAAGIMPETPDLGQSERPGGPLMSDRVPPKDGPVTMMSENIEEGFQGAEARIKFDEPVAVQAVNVLNKLYRKEGSGSDAVMVDKFTVDIHSSGGVFGGIDVDITDYVLDKLGGMYDNIEPDIEPGKHNPPGGGRDKFHPVQEDDSDLDWGDELIEDLKLLLDETEYASSADEIRNGVVDLISQYDSHYDHK